MNYQWRADRRPARHGAKATGPKIDRLEYTRCPSCHKGVIFDALSRSTPRCPHCDEAVG